MDEIKKVLHTEGKEEENVEDMMKTIDINGDGEVSFKFKCLD